VNILLLNDNPVVNKLVTLSAQKTSDVLTIVKNLDELQSGSYDLRLIDDGMYEEDLLTKIKETVAYDKSLFICSKDAPKVDAFTATFKKPFLPTDLVELFLLFAKESNLPPQEKEEFTPLAMEDNDEEQISDLEDLDLANEDLLDEDFDISSLDDELSLDDGLDDTEFKPEELDDLSLDEFSFADMDDDETDNELNKSILDKDEVEEVKNLLDEEESDLNDELDADFDDELSMDDSLDDLKLDEEEPALEDEALLATELDEDLELGVVEDDLELDETLLEELSDDSLDDFSFDEEKPTVEEEPLAETKTASDENLELDDSELDLDELTMV